MNCLSSEDLKEERNCSLTLDATLNPYACQIPPTTVKFGGNRLRQLLIPFLSQNHLTRIDRGREYWASDRQTSIGDGRHGRKYLPVSV
jgi:hypothetical protein